MIPFLIGVRMAQVAVCPLLPSAILLLKDLIVVMVKAQCYDDCWFRFCYGHMLLFFLESLFLTLRCFGHPVSERISVV